MLKTQIALILLVTGSALSQDCDDCPEGEVPGAGTVTATYTSKVDILSTPECTGVRCYTVTLSGTQETDGIGSYDGIVIDATGTIVASDNTCCTQFAPSVATIEGTITSYLGGAIVVEYTRVEPPTIFTTSTLIGDPGTCTALNITEISGGGGIQTTEQGIVSFSGGVCEDPTIVDPPVIDPPDPPDAPDPPDPPLPDDPPPPDEPNNDPDVPEPDPDDNPDDPDGTDDNPAPPIDDECCIAITTRLDSLIMWEGTNAAYQSAQLQTLQYFRADMSTYFHDLIYGQDQGDGAPGVLQTNNLQNAQIIANQQHQISYMERYDGYLFDAVWYLEQIANSDFDPGTNAPPTTDKNFTPTSSTQALIGLEQAHIDSSVEEGNQFQKLDIAEMQDSAAPTMTIAMGGMADGLGLNLGNITVDFSPYQAIRDLVHAGMLILATLGAIQLVWGELRKQ